MTVWWAYEDHADLGLPGPDADLTEDMRPQKDDSPEAYRTPGPSNTQPNQDWNTTNHGTFTQS